MQKNNNLFSAAWILIYPAFLFVFLLKYRTNYNSVELKLFFALLASYIICGFLLLVAKFNHDLYLFEPFSFATLIYIAIFVYRPLVDLYAGDVSARGISVLGGGYKATVIFTLSYCCLYYGYFVLSKRITLKLERMQAPERVFPIQYSQTGNIYPLVGWAVSFVLSIVCMISQGASLSYIFTLSASGERVVDEGNVALLFLSNFGITLVSFWLMLILKPGNRLIKIVVTVLSAVYIVMRNARWLLLVFLGAPFVYYYVKRKKRPNLLLLTFGSVLLLTLFAWMQLNRPNIIHGGQMIGLFDNWLSFDTLLSPFDSDLTTYKVFYGMVNRFPSEYSYMYGKTFLYTFLLFIPRSLWPSKPQNPVLDVTEYSLNAVARRAGAAVANIGEFYVNFGVVGVVLLSVLFGIVISKLKVLYEKPNEERLMVYSIMWLLLYQWVARGYFGGNLYVVIFAMLPFFVLLLAKRLGISELKLRR